MSFIDVLYEEILLEIEGGEVPKSIQKILAKLVYSEPFIARLFSRSHTDWIQDNSISTAGVRPYQGRIQFSYNSSFINGLSPAEINFLLQHELYHIFRKHSERAAAAGATTKRTHRLANIAMDSLINAESEKDGGFGGLPMKVIEGGWFLKEHAGNFNSVEEHWQKDKKDVYNGSPNTEPIYKWMKQRDADAQKKEEPEEGEGEGEGGEGGPPPPQWEPTVGDIIKNKKTGEYGRVTDLGHGKAKVEKISKEEAYAETKAKSAGKKFIKKPIITKSIMTKRPATKRPATKRPIKPIATKPGPKEIEPIEIISSIDTVIDNILT